MLSTEILFSIGLLGALIGIATGEYQQAMIKAKLTEVLYAFDGKKLLLQEQLALTGDMPTAQSKLSKQQPTSASHDEEIEAALAYKVSRSTTVSEDAHELAGYAAPGQGYFGKTEKPVKSSADHTIQSLSKVDNSLVLNFKPDGSGKQYFLAFTPAVIDTGIPGSILWLCGNKQPPGGWVRLPGVSGTDLPEKYLYNNCRSSKGY